MRRAATAPAVLLVLSIVAPLRADSVIAAVEGKVYHSEADCVALRKVESVNRLVYKTAAEAEAAGLRRCKLCERRAARRTQADSSEKLDRKPPATTQPDRSDSNSVEIESISSEADFLLKDGDRLSLLGVAMPLSGQEGHDEAVAILRKQLTAGTAISTRPLGGIERDDFGRLLAYLEAGDDRQDLGCLLISSGLAWPRANCEHPHRGDYLRLEAEAWQKGLGIWKRLEGEAGQVEVVVGRFARSYHGEACPHDRYLIEPSKVPLNEAKARRLTPCELYQAAARPSVPKKAGKNASPTSRRSSGKVEDPPRREARP
jgi:endonuclease YncB( thermonuclease family)